MATVAAPSLEMVDSFLTRNYTALALLILGKIIGILGLVAGWMGHRAIGGGMLGLYGLCVVATIVLCLTTMRRRNRHDDAHKQALAEMLREGTLDAHLREVKQAERAREEARDALGQTVLS